MKQLKFLFTLCLFSLLAVSCGDDDDDISGGDCTDSVALTNAITDEINAISAATTAYFNDMSTSNCNALKDAYQDYIDELKSWSNCANQLGQGTQWQADIAEAEAGIDNLC